MKTPRTQRARESGIFGSVENVFQFAEILETELAAEKELHRLAVEVAKRDMDALCAEIDSRIPMADVQPLVEALRTCKNHHFFATRRRVASALATFNSKHPKP